MKSKKFTGLFMVPKYDGSLFNLTYIDKKNSVYPKIKDLIDNSPKIPKDFKSFY